jgi:hypothetical protein
VGGVNHGLLPGQSGLKIDVIIKNLSSQLLSAFNSLQLTQKLTIFLLNNLHKKKPAPFNFQSHSLKTHKASVVICCRLFAFKRHEKSSLGPD